MTEQQDVLADILSEGDPDERSDYGDFANLTTGREYAGSILDRLAARGYALVRTPETLDVEAVVRAIPGYVQSTTVGGDDSVTAGMEPDDGSGLWQGAWVQKGVVVAALRAASDMAGHRTRETHDCFLMNCRDLGDEVEQLQSRLVTTPFPTRSGGCFMSDLIKTRFVGSDECAECGRSLSPETETT